MNFDSNIRQQNIKKEKENLDKIHKEELKNFTKDFNDKYYYEMIHDYNQGYNTYTIPVNDHKNLSFNEVDERCDIIKYKINDKISIVCSKNILDERNMTIKFNPSIIDRIYYYSLIERMLGR